MRELLALTLTKRMTCRDPLKKSCEVEENTACSGSFCDDFEHLRWGMRQVARRKNVHFVRVTQVHVTPKQPRTPNSKNSRVLNPK